MRIRVFAPADASNGDRTSADAVDAAIANALDEATLVRRRDVVAQLARELEARRLARIGNVVSLGRTRR